MRTRSRREFDDESAGVLATPTPDLGKIAVDLHSRFGFLGNLNADERTLLTRKPGDREIAIEAIKAIPGARFATIPLQ